MNGFLDNLLQRHRGESSNNLPLVEPRRRQRFESASHPDPGVDIEESYGVDSDSGEMPTAARREGMDFTPSPPTRRQEDVGDANGHDDAGLDHRRGSAGVQPDRDAVMAEISNEDSPPIAPSRQTPSPIAPAESEPSAESLATQQPARLNTFDTRRSGDPTGWTTQMIRQAVEENMRGIIDRLQSRVEMVDGERLDLSGSIPMDISADGTGDNPTSTTAIEEPVDYTADHATSKVHPQTQAAGKDHGGAMPNRGVATEMPDWLGKLREEFANRWHEPRAETPNEPVINVHIGRVEVRAIDNGVTPQPAKERKPRGMMSLEDYVVQRAKGGSR